MEVLALTGAESTACIFPDTVIDNFNFLFFVYFCCGVVQQAHCVYLSWVYAKLKKKSLEQSPQNI